MKILRVEPTPSPNSMKLTLTVRLNPGVRLNYEKGQEDKAPLYIRRLLAIPGVTGVYHTADFLALERHPKADWQLILTGAEQVLGVAAAPSGQGDREGGNAPDQEMSYGEVTVRIQTFRGIPMQIRVSSGLEEQRAALPERFQQAAVQAGLGSPNLIMERKLEEHGVRYGELAEVLDVVTRELEAVYDEARLARLVERSLSAHVPADSGQLPAPAVHEDVSALLDHPDWQVRYTAVERLAPDLQALPYLRKALRDGHASVRRLAVVYTADIREEETLPLLIQALQDRLPIIRRTAGDCLSDRGDAAAIPAMEQALADKSKLVRWRAARFLYDLGGPSSLSALKKAADDPEFEIRLQVRLAIQRIEGGEKAQGTVWQQMMRRNES